MRPFRFTCPTPGVEVVLRPRLLRLVGSRWDHRVVTVVAPAGFGKTTLLAQATEENALAPRGADVWVTCEPADSGGASLAGALLRALGEPDGPVAEGAPERIAAAVWRRAPEHISLVLDDVHEIGPETPGAELLGELVVELPANAHLVFVGRSEPPVRLSRLEGAGQVVRVDEPMLRLTPDELEVLARQRSRDPDVLEPTAGWPALVALTLAAGEGGAGADRGERYVWDEVLYGVAPSNRRALAAAVLVGAGDDEVATAAADRPVCLAELVDGLPLVERRPSVAGAPVIHPLWAEVLAGELAPHEQAAALRRAATVHHQRRQLAEAVELLARAGDWSAVRSIIVEACASRQVEVGHPTLRRWRSLLPREERGPETDLLDGLLHRAEDPGSDRARGLLRRAADDFRDRHDQTGEVGALAQLVHMAWHEQQVDELGRLLDRAAELAAAGCAPASRVALLGRVLAANASQDFAGALTIIGTVDRATLSPAWDATLDALGSIVLLMLGRTEEALPLADRAAASPSAPAGAAVDALVVRWFSGRPLDVLARLPLPPEATRTAYGAYVHDALTAIAFAATGRAEEAAVAVESLRVHLGTLTGVMPAAVAASTAAGVDVARADEQAAVDGLGAFLATHALTPGPVEQAVRRFLTLFYVLRPETRAVIDGQAYGPAWAEQRAVARALVAVREGRPVESPPVTPERVVTALPLPWAVELGEALAGDGHASGPALLLWLLEHLGPPARKAVRAAPDLRRRPGGGARAVLAAVPVPPEEVLRVDAIGPAALWRGQQPVDEPAWRREKVRLLLLYLLVHRRVTREDVAAALWPDLDDRRAGHNLRVNLNHLHNLLEPERTPGEAPWFVRHRDAGLEIHEGRHLAVDVWEVDRALDAADEAERAGIPSAVLDANRQALRRWRGEPLADARYEDWAAHERDRLHRRLVRAAVRTGELVLAQGDALEAEAHAHRALAAEPWSEGGYRLLVGACLEQGDRAGALRAVERCREALADMGVAPDPLTAAAFRRAIGGE